MGVGPAYLNPHHLARNRGWHPVPAPGRWFFSGNSAFVGVGDLLGSVVSVKTRGPLDGRESIHFHGHGPKDPVNLARYLKCVARCRKGSFWWECLPRACPARHPGPKPASRSSDKSYPLGASTLFVHP